MSEYQYYEFQAIDRPLTREEQEAVASLSSAWSRIPARDVCLQLRRLPGQP
jgi:hypothetical protein